MYITTCTLLCRTLPSSGTILSALEHWTYRRCTPGALFFSAKNGVLVFAILWNIRVLQKRFYVFALLKYSFMFCFYKLLDFMG